MLREGQAHSAKLMPESDRRIGHTRVLGRKITTAPTIACRIPGTATCHGRLSCSRVRAARSILPVTVLNMQGAVYQEASANNALAMQEFVQICHTHTDYMWSNTNAN